MGLGLSHDAGHWSYSGFHDFRKWLAAKINIDLDEMEGFASIRNDGTPRKSWADVPPDILVALLHHSDCDGEIAPDLLAPLAERIREVVGLAIPIGLEDKYNWRAAIQLAHGCDRAADCGQALRFS